MNSILKYRGLYEILPLLLVEPVKAGKEYFKVKMNNKQEMIVGVWEYGKMYEHPYLYDIIFSDILKLNAPVDLISWFKEVVGKIDDLKRLRVLELAAGSGLAGKEVKEFDHTELLVGVDIIEQAKIAASRDQPGIYDNYLVCNFEHLSEKDVEYFLSCKFNCFFVATGTGGADDDSGYEDVMLNAYKQAIALLEPESYIFFNIRQIQTTGQKLILKYPNERCKMIERKLHHFRNLIDGTKVYAEFVIMQLQ